MQIAYGHTGMWLEEIIMRLNHRERMERTLLKEKTDQIPISLWNHFPVDDQHPESLAKATIAFQNLYDFDFVKVMPPSSYCLKDWGSKDFWNGNIEGTRDYLTPVIKTQDDWRSLDILNPNEGHLGRYLECLKILKQNLPSDVPFIQSIFNPLSQAKNLAGKNRLLSYLRKNPEALHEGLKTITKTTIRFMEECINLKIDGFFFAVQHASYDLISDLEFDDFILNYDSQLFKLVDTTWLNMLHIHGENIMFEKMCQYPFQIFNWHDRDTSPDLKQGKKLSGSSICGGLSRINTMVLGNEKVIKSEITDAFKQTEGKGYIVGTGCVMPLNTPYGNILSAINATHSLS